MKATRRGAGKVSDAVLIVGMVALVVSAGLGYVIGSKTEKSRMKEIEAPLKRELEDTKQELVEAKARIESDATAMLAAQKRAGELQTDLAQALAEKAQWQTKAERATVELAKAKRDLEMSREAAHVERTFPEPSEKSRAWALGLMRTEMNKRARDLSKRLGQKVDMIVALEDCDRLDTVPELREECGEIEDRLHAILRRMQELRMPIPEGIYLLESSQDARDRRKNR